jgi:hypothetical protein
MSLKTYDRPVALDQSAIAWSFVPLSSCGDPSCDEPLSPGDWVKHKTDGGRGMVIAINDEQLTILWSEEPSSGFGNFVFPNVRRVHAPLIAQQLVSIQPMTSPVGSIFYMDYAYGPKAELDRKCNEGPHHVRMYWQARRRLSMLWAFLVAWFGRVKARLNPPKPNDAALKRLGWMQKDLGMHNEALQQLVKKLGETHGTR